MIELISGAPEPTVIRDRYPTWDENTALLKVSGKWLLYSPYAGKLFEYEFAVLDAGLKESGIIIRAVSHDGAPISLEVEG